MAQYFQDVLFGDVLPKAYKEPFQRSQPSISRALRTVSGAATEMEYSCNPHAYIHPIMSINVDPESTGHQYSEGQSTF